MDRNSIIGFILIGLVLMLWMWLNAPPPNQPAASVDSIKVKTQTVDTTHVRNENQTYIPRITDTLGGYFRGFAHGEEKIFEIKTDKYRAVVSTYGGNIKLWELSEYKTWDQHQVNLINRNKSGDFNLLFTSSDGKIINTRNLFFISNFVNNQFVELGEKESLAVEFVLKISDKSRIIKRLLFTNGKYEIEADYTFERMEGVIANYEYQVTWENGLRYSEHNSIDESGFAVAAAMAGGELTEIDPKGMDEPVKQNISGRVSWVASRTKYFVVAIIPLGIESQGAYLEGVRHPLADQGAREEYQMALKIPFLGKSQEKSKFILFLGPLNFNVVKRFNIDLDQIMSLGAAWIIRPISEYVIIPLFQFLRLFIPNYGFVIIIFSLIIKVVLYPLTKSSMKSMQKMQALQPLMNEIKEKYKEDPQKMNQQVMRLYKEYGVNPAGGCLPMLLQLPILYALWAVFRSTIELRQAKFLWWISDLSIPDVIARLPARIPIININELSGLSLLMGITMFVQQKMSVKDPRQKMMVWMMPLLMTLMFNSFPSGLNLYYFIFNLLSIAQQAWMNKKHKDEPLRKVEPKKSSGGWISKIATDLPKKKKH